MIAATRVVPDAVAPPSWSRDLPCREHRSTPLTRQVAANKGHVDDAAWAAAIDAGWSERQILEAYAEVVRTIFTNYFNHLVGTELDLPAAPELT